MQSSEMHLLRKIFDDSDIVTRGSRSTVSAQFRKSLDQLMQQLNKTQPFFVRCIKPNENKKALTMECELVLKQLRYCGMLDTIKIRSRGYPVRHEFAPFVRRYRVLVNSIGAAQQHVDNHLLAERICKEMLGHDSDFQLGKTKVFLKEKDDLYLEQEYHRIVTHRATVIQSWVKGWIARRSFNSKKEATIVVQKHWRRYIHQKRYMQIVAGLCRLQAVVRSRQLISHYQTLRHRIIHFQAVCRGATIRTKLIELRRAGGRKIVAEEGLGVDNRDELKQEDLVRKLFDFLPSDSRVDDSGNDSTTTSITSVSPIQVVHDDCDSEKYQFDKFAATYFQSQISTLHSKKPLKSSLLSHEDNRIQLAAMAVWVMILRFMGDLPEVESKSNPGDLKTDKTPVMSRLYKTLARKCSACSAEENAVSEDVAGRKLKSNTRGKLTSTTLMAKTLRHSAEDSLSSSSDHCASSSHLLNVFMDNTPMSSLDKIHYIIGMGILMEDLRDEIYCQLCKQLSSNPSRLSAARGWILLSLCVGSFAPSPRFTKYLYCFIREHGPTGAGYSAYMEERLKRTEQNGCRRQPPSFIELKANKVKKQIMLTVTLMDGSVKTLGTDSATTASELCAAVAEAVNLKDKFGFSIYIAQFDKVSSLGSGSNHVMDAISQCEQYAKEQGRQEQSALWKLFFRKEIFTPWHDAREDPISTDLIYQQVVRGIKYGEYRCEKESDLASLVAQQYYVEEGPLDVNRLEHQIHNYLPDYELNEKELAKERWTQAVMRHYRLKFGANPPSAHHVKEDVVSFTKSKWPMLFSRFYEATKLYGHSLALNDVIIAVNWTGIYIVDDQERILLKFSYPEVTKVFHHKRTRPALDMCTIRTACGDEYSFQSHTAEHVKNLVTVFLNGLKQRSQYLIATKRQQGDDSNDLLDFEVGDLLVLNGVYGKDLLNKNFIRGECLRTCVQGVILADNVYVLPTLISPDLNTLQLFPKGEQVCLDILNNNQVLVVQNTARPHTLEQFALNNFRSPSQSLSTQRSLMTIQRSELDISPQWRFGCEPLDVPLLKKLEGRNEQSRDAITMFMFVMKYMGDQPSRRSRLGTDLTDVIFKPAITHDILRDELYCQLLRQITVNPSMLSEDRGWELVWLATGLFAPSASLLKEVVLFLKSRHHPIAHDCLCRIKKLNKGYSRKFPPHLVEVEAIQNKTTQIFHKVYFPDQSYEAIEVESSTRACDFVYQIAQRLHLKKREGFSLFVKIKEKVLAVPETEFFFDFIRHLSDWVHNNHAMKENMLSLNYQVFFMRKLWVGVRPGEDTNADLIFHYHQECPKYLLGYYKVMKQEAVDLATLILRAITKDFTNAPIAQIPQLLSELVPKDMINVASVKEWRKSISCAYAKVEHLRSDEAKTQFLTTIYKKETFGSAFFPVSQYSDLSLPDKLLVAINYKGVHLYHKESKALITQYPFNVICNWTSGNTYFNMTIRNDIRGIEGKKLLLDTTMGYKMDDLITSYISLLISKQTYRPSQINESVT